MFETIIECNGESIIATINLKGNNLMYDHLELLAARYPEECIRTETGYTVPRSWVRILPYTK